MFLTRQRTYEPSVVWSRVSEAPIDAIVMQDLKAWIQRPLEDDFWNAEATALILAAQRAIERRCEVALGTSVWMGVAPIFPARISKRPFIGVTKLEYVNPKTGEIVEIPAANYVAAPDLQRDGQMLAAVDYEWPKLAVRPDAVRVTVSAGYGNALPQDLVHALLMTVAALDSNRGDSGGGSRLDNTVWGQTVGATGGIIPKGAMALLAPYLYQRITMA
jgi:hypothetical protein